MFDNIGTALVQAFGFFAIFGYFVYQTLFANRNSENSKLNTDKRKDYELKKSNNINNKKLFFNNKKSSQTEVQIKKKGLFNRAQKIKQENTMPKKNKWFR